MGLGLAAISVQDHLGLRDFDTLLRQRLNRVLGLRATGTNTRAFLRRVGFRSASGYTLDSGQLKEVPFSDMGILAGAGEIISTGNDMLKVVRLLAGLDRGPLAAASVEATRVLDPGAEGRQICYAIDAEMTPGGLRYSKSGSCAGYSAFVTFQRDPPVGVVVLANRGGFSGTGKMIGQAVLDALLPSTPPAPTASEVITCPLRLFRYSFESDPTYDATFDRGQIKELLAEVNEIWSQAGIKWELTSVEDHSVPRSVLPSVTALDDNVKLRDAFSQISPQASGERAWNAVLLRTMPVTAGGLYWAPTQTTFYSELNPRGNHHPEIFAHELGHSLLGGEHSDDTCNVMVGGSPDPSLARELTPEQIEQARSQARVGPLSAQRTR